VSDTRAEVKRFLEGHRAAEERQRELVEERGAIPAQAVAECLDALAAMEQMGVWPGPRDPVAEREVWRVRSLWSKVKREYRSGGTS
jgi:hypothetical protein